MSRFHIALGLSSFLAIAGATLMAPTVASAQPVERTYVACNQYGECWRVHRVYAYGADAPITYYNSDWYDAHERDEHVHWVSDPSDDRGYYDRESHWHADPGISTMAAAQAVPALAATGVLALLLARTRRIGCCAAVVAGRARSPTPVYRS